MLLIEIIWIAAMHIWATNHDARFCLRVAIVVLISAAPFNKQLLPVTNKSEHLKGHSVPCIHNGFALDKCFILIYPDI